MLPSATKGCSSGATSSQLDSWFPNTCWKCCLRLQANEALQACLTIQEAALGLDHPEVADTLQELATTLEAQGLKHQAEPVLRQCLAIRSHALGMQHPDTAAVLHALACLLSGDR